MWTISEMCQAFRLVFHISKFKMLLSNLSIHSQTKQMCNRGQPSGMPLSNCIGMPSLLCGSYRSTFALNAHLKTFRCGTTIQVFPML